MQRKNENEHGWYRQKTQSPKRQGGGLALLLFLGILLFISPGGAAPIADYNNVMIHVANPEGPAYNVFGNGSYLSRFEGSDRGLNALHISTDPAVNFGQVTTTANQSGTFYATDSGGKGYEDEILLLVAVNGTIPDDFKLHVTADGYTWTPNPVSNQPPTSSTYNGTTLDETFTKADLVYGPQNWKPTGNGYSYPIYYGQDTTDTTNTFQLMLIDLNAGVLRPNAALENRGAVRIHYSFENLNSFAAFNVYGYCKTSNNGYDMIAWTNSLMPDRTPSGYSVTASSPVQKILPLPNQQHTPLDHDGDGRYEDLNGNGQTDFSDVVLFFNQMDWIADNEPVDAFDFNKNGKIDFGDVVSLFIRI
jgi:PKD repeat protein